MTFKLKIIFFTLRVIVSPVEKYRVDQFCVKTS